jgi:hypothetical protein
MNKADAVRLDLIHRMPCIVCGRQPVEAHHIVDGGYRKHSGGHQSTIPLCVWHHRGDPPPEHSAKAMLAMHGPSLARSKRHFVQMFGTERELLASVNTILRGIH